MKKNLVTLSALAASLLFVGHGTASAQTATTIPGTTSGTYFIVQTPWAQSVAVNVMVGRTRSAAGVLGQTKICFENTVTGDVAVAVPPQLANGQLTSDVRVIGSAKDDYFQVLTAGGRAARTEEGFFCSNGTTGLFPGVDIVHARAGGKRVVIEARAGNDAVIAYSDSISTVMGAGNDLSYVFAHLFFHADTDDGATGIDNVYSLNPSLDNDSAAMGSNPRDCMTDYSGRIQQLSCGGDGSRVFFTTIPAGQTRITDPQLALCHNRRMITSVEQCYEIIESAR